MTRSNRLSNTLSFEPLKPKINITFIRTPFLRSFLGLQGYQLISVLSLQSFNCFEYYACEIVKTFWLKCDFPKYLAPLLFGLCPSIPKSIYKKNLPYLPFPAAPINCYVLIHSYTTHSTKAILTYLIYMNLAALTPILQGDIT